MSTVVLRTALGKSPLVRALKDGKFGAYFGDQHAMVHAFDAATGKLLWETKIDDYPNARVVGSASASTAVGISS